jgi:dipeptidyl aminopeptidase/acylaminoacyl peptidase
VDFLSAREDVDSQRLAVVGLSQAGYWVPRALAFEHRFAAAVADGGVVDVSTSWLQHMPPQMIELLDAGDRETFDEYMRAGLLEDPAAAALFAWRAKPYGRTSPFEVYTEVRRYSLASVVDRIRTPLLITDPDDEQFWPGQSQRLYEALPGAKDLVRFTREEGAAQHCEPLGRALFEQRVFDWIESRLLPAAVAG